MAALKDWLMAVIAVSILCAAADSLMPEGAVKRVGKLACSLCVLCVTLSPLAAVRGESMTGWLDGLAAERDALRAELEEQTGRTQKMVIEEHCEAYISDKAEELGLDCRVEVDCAPNPEGLWLPESVRLWGEFDDVAQSRMTELLERQLGLAVVKQTYYRTKEAEP